MYYSSCHFKLQSKWLACSIGACCCKKCCKATPSACQPERKTNKTQVKNRDSNTETEMNIINKILTTRLIVPHAFISPRTGKFIEWFRLLPEFDNGSSTYPWAMEVKPNRAPALKAPSDVRPAAPTNGHAPNPTWNQGKSVELAHRKRGGKPDFFSGNVNIPSGFLVLERSATCAK